MRSSPENCRRRSTCEAEYTKLRRGLELSVVDEVVQDFLLHAQWNMRMTDAGVEVDEKHRSIALVDGVAVTRATAAKNFDFR